MNDDELLAEINRLVAKLPKGRLRYWGGGDGVHQWTLSGMTPVTATSVLRELRDSKKIDQRAVARCAAEVEARARALQGQRARRERLRRSASAKLSAAERRAVGLAPDKADSKPRWSW